MPIVDYALFFDITFDITIRGFTPPDFYITSFQDLVSDVL